jgi:hypothetical protein
MPLSSKSRGGTMIKQERIEFDALEKVLVMTNRDCLTSACRYCRFYQPEGLHGGACQQLGVNVRSEWKACQLALPAFANSWENAEELTHRQVEIPQLLRIEEHAQTNFRVDSALQSVNN